MQKPSRGCAVALSLSLVLAGCNWAHVGFGPARTGYNSVEKTISAQNVSTLTQKWAVSLLPPSDIVNVVLGHPVVGDGKVYVTAESGTGTAGCIAPETCKSGIYARDAATGGARWAQEYGPGVDGRPPQLFQLALSGGRLFAGVGRLVRPPGPFVSEINAFDGVTGALRWTAPGGVFPAVVGDVVYSGYVNTFATSGWSANDVHSGAALFGGVGSPLAPAVDRGLLYGVDDAGRLVSYDATGSAGCSGPATARVCQPLWTSAAAYSRLPVVANGLVYVGSNDGKLSAFNASGCGSASCKPQWTGATGGNQAAWIAVANGVAYVESWDGRLYAFAASGCGNATCAPLWSAPTGQIGSALPSVANGVVFVGSEDGKLYAVNAAGCGAANCSPIWSKTLDGPIQSSPAIANGMVFVATKSGTLYAFGLPAPP